jgi:DNA-binding response OmpR family regulator
LAKTSDPDGRPHRRALRVGGACIHFTCIAVRALQGARVVLLTARGQAQDRDAGQEAGADEYLIKPFSPLQLIETIERLMPSA